MPTQKESSERMALLLFLFCFNRVT
jgi:hypothetical protein